MPTRNTPECLMLPSQGEAHVWTVLLSEHLTQLTALEQLLSSDERQRAARFLRPDDRTRYIVAHGILRQILSRYLSVEPAGLFFHQNDFGKPFLAPGMGKLALTFNLAHSGDVVLYAFSSGRRIGIDVEAVRTDLDVMALARSQFSSDEIQTLQTMRPADRTAAFFCCWTRKEACVKALGEGLSYPLNRFSVSFRREEPPKVLWMGNDSGAHERWSVLDLSIIAGYAGAVVCEGRDLQFVTKHWAGPG